MPYQNIDAVLTDNDFQEIKNQIQAIEGKLPFLITLTVDERRKLYKMGDKSIAFVTNCLSAAQANPDILPASFALEGFEKDVQLAGQLTELQTLLQQLLEKVDDTRLAVGSEAMTGGRTFYDYVKAAVNFKPGLKSLVAQLGERFKAATRRSSGETGEE